MIIIFVVISSVAMAGNCAAKWTNNSDNEYFYLFSYSFNVYVHMLHNLSAFVGVLCLMHNGHKIMIVEIMNICVIFVF